MSTVTVTVELVGYDHTEVGRYLVGIDDDLKPGVSRVFSLEQGTRYYAKGSDGKFAKPTTEFTAVGETQLVKVYF